MVTLKRLFQLALVTVFSTANAQQESLDIGDIVITGTKTKRALVDAPVKTEVIKQKEISENHFDSLEEAITVLPGVNLQANTGRAGSSAIIQGLGDRHVLIMIDGVPVLQRSSSGFDLSQIATDNIQQVEVIKGGASSLYGSQAIGGVINIITKKPSEKTTYAIDMKSGAFNGKATTKEELPATFKASIAGKVFKKSRFSFNFSHRQRGQYDLDPSTITQDSNSFNKDNTSFIFYKELKNKSDFKVSYTFMDESNFQVSSAATPDGFAARNNFGEAQSQSLTLAYQRSLGKDSQLKLTANTKKVAESLILGDDPITKETESLTESEQTENRLEAQWDTLVADSHLITSGLVYKDESLNQINTTQSGSASLVNNDVDQKSTVSSEVYIQDNIMLENFEVTPGLRIQQNKGFGRHSSATVNAIYSAQWLKNHQTKIRASVGTGYRTPSLKERFYMLDHRALANYIVQGQNKLSPETSIGYQLGIELVKKKTYSFHVNAFLNQVNQLIDVKELGKNDAGILEYKYINHDQVQSYGTEVSFNYQVSPKFHTEQEFTYTETKNTLTGLLLPRRPLYNYNLRLKYDISSKIKAINSLRYKSAQFSDEKNRFVTPSYMLVDLKLNYKWNPNTTIYLGANNIFDEVRNAAIDSAGSSSFFSQGDTFVDNRPILGRFIYLGLNLKR